MYYLNSALLPKNNNNFGWFIIKNNLLSNSTQDNTMLYHDHNPIFYKFEQVQG